MDFDVKGNFITGFKLLIISIVMFIFYQMFAMALITGVMNLNASLGMIVSGLALLIGITLSGFVATTLWGWE